MSAAEQAGRADAFGAKKAARRATATGEIGPYQLISVLGQSELGCTYRARDKAGNLITVAQLDTDDLEIRRRFKETVRGLATTSAATSSVLGADVAGTRPWVATARGLRPGAEQLLTELGGRYVREPVPVEREPFPAFTSPPPAMPWRRWPRLFPGAVGVAVALLLVFCGTAATAVVLMTLPASSPTRAPSPPPTEPANTTPTPPAPKPSPAPKVKPAPEPPTPGDWPADWAKFASGESTYPMDLAGFGFGFRVPRSWGCLRMESGNQYTKWRCIDEQGAASAGKGRPGGDLVVRACPGGCPAETQRKLRADIDTYGQKWIEPEKNSTYAEGKNLTTTAGSGRYVLVLSRFWRSKAGGPLDRQVTVRLATPGNRAAEAQKIVNDIRANTR